MTTDAASQLEKQLGLVNWIDVHLRVSLPTDQRAHCATGCFDVTIEHHAAILLLAQSQLYGSMFALIRVIFESYARGLWLRHCATDKELQKFTKDKLDLGFADLVQDVETALNLTDGPLSKLKADSWGLMNSLTHTGYKQVRSRHSEHATGGNYSEAAIAKALELAGSIALLASVELALYSGSDELVALARRKGSEYAAE